MTAESDRGWKHLSDSGVGQMTRWRLRFPVRLSAQHRLFPIKNIRKKNVHPAKEDSTFRFDFLETTRISTFNRALVSVERNSVQLHASPIESPSRMISLPSHYTADNLFAARLLKFARANKRVYLVDKEISSFSYVPINFSIITGEK